MARREADLGPLAGDARWKALEERPGMAVWTDDFSNLVGVMKWKSKTDEDVRQTRRTGPGEGDRAEGATPPATSTASGPAD
jgi:hypothetical protein